MSWQQITIISLCFILNALLSAQPFQFINRQGVNPTTNSLLDQIEVEVNKRFPDIEPQDYAPAMANTNAQASNSVGSDYANDIDLFLVSANGSAAVDSSSFDALDGSNLDTVDGFGIGSALTLATNTGLFYKKKIGRFDTRKLDIFLSFYNLDRKDKMTLDGFSYKNTSFSLHARYHLLEGQSLYSTYLLRWGGLYLTSGFQVSSTQFRITDSFRENRSDSGANADFSAVSTLSVNSHTRSIPIEISTNLRVLYFLTLYGGVGVNFNFGDSNITAAVDGDIILSGSASGSADAFLNLSGSDNVDLFSSRVFLGAQINISILKLYAQYSKSIGSNITTATAGLKLTW